MKLLFVCMGNICRSPMAEGIVKHKLKEAGLSELVTVDSAGTGAWHAGEEPDGRGQACMRQKGIDISDQVARQFEIFDFDEFDRIFAMDESNYADLLDQIRYPSDRKKVELFLDLVPELGVKGVPDPYYRSEDGFEKVYELLDQASDKLIDQIKDQLNR